MIRPRPLLTLLALLLPLCAPAPAAAQKAELVIGMTQFPSTLHPNIGSMLAKNYIQAMTMRPVTIPDPDWQLVCLLCEELPTIENGLAELDTLADGSETIAVTYTLKPDIAWGDGTPVTTEDVVFTWEAGKHPQGGVASADFYNHIVKIDVKDARTFTLHVDKVTFSYNNISDFSLLPAHLEKPVFEENPAEYRNRTLYDTDPDNPGLYFGPYRITNVDPGSSVTLVPNETWFGEAPHFKRITIRIIENTAALEANLLSGSIDYIAGELGLQLDQALAFEKRHPDRFEFLYKPGLIWEHIDTRLDNPLLADRRVRQALLLGLDRESINARLFQGKQPVAATSVNPLDWVYTEDGVATYPYDPERAAALLDAAGFSELRDGVRHNADGDRLSVSLLTTAGNRTRELIQQVIQAQWKQLGIDVQLKTQPPRVFSDSLNFRKVDSLAMYAWLMGPEAVPRSLLHSEEIPSEANNWAGQNYVGYRNPEMDELLEAIEVELDREKRAELWIRYQRLFAEELPILPLYFRTTPFVVPKWLKGIVPTGHKFSTTHWVETWRAE